jgi:hypothetical protein
MKAPSIQALLSGCLLMCLPVCAADGDLPVVFADPNLKIAVETALGVKDPTRGQMAQLAQLDAVSMGIVSLQSLEYATSLVVLDVGLNNVTDISALSGLIDDVRMYNRAVKP